MTKSLNQICDVIKVISTEITEKDAFCQIIYFTVANELYPA